MTQCTDTIYQYNVLDVGKWAGGSKHEIITLIEYVCSLEEHGIKFSE